MSTLRGAQRFFGVSPLNRRNPRLGGVGQQVNTGRGGGYRLPQYQHQQNQGQAQGPSTQNQAQPRRGRGGRFFRGRGGNRQAWGGRNANQDKFPREFKLNNANVGQRRGLQTRKRRAQNRKIVKMIEVKQEMLRQEQEQLEQRKQKIVQGQQQQLGMGPRNQPNRRWNNRGRPMHTGARVNVPQFAQPSSGVPVLRSNNPRQYQHQASESMPVFAGSEDQRMAVLSEPSEESQTMDLEGTLSIVPAQTTLSLNERFSGQKVALPARVIKQQIF